MVNLSMSWDKGVFLSGLCGPQYGPPRDFCWREIYIYILMVLGSIPLTRTNIIYKYTNIKNLKNPNYYLHTLKPSF